MMLVKHLASKMAEMLARKKVQLMEEMMEMQLAGTSVRTKEKSMVEQKEFRWVVLMESQMVLNLVESLVLQMVENLALD